MRMSAAKEHPSMIFNKPLLARLVVLAALLALYLSFDWMSLRLWLSGAGAFVLSHLGYPAAIASHQEGVFLTVSDTRFLITPACTYLDLALILIVFTWRVGRSWAANLFRTAAVMTAVLSLNVGRLALAAILHEGGMAWRFSHDLPDFVLYYATLVGVVILCARSDWRWLDREPAGSPC